MNELLNFEKEKCRDPRCFPMYFRLKLDVCGIKLSKRDWSSFAPAERERLLAMPCETTEQLAAFRNTLKTIIQSCNGGSTEIIPAGEAAASLCPWTNKAVMPEAVRQQVDVLTNGKANLSMWALLSDLQRFTLIKLTEPGKVKKELRMVLEEFAVLPTR